MASDALADGFDELMWIDSDTDFDPLVIDRLRAHQLPIVGAIYPVKGERRLACRVMPGTDEIIFGSDGGLLEVEYLANGFLFIRREVYSAMRTRFKMPVCAGNNQGLVPYFQPLVHFEKKSGRYLYLSDGFSFCERARQCGFKVFADTTIRLGHIGKTTYSWEEAGSSVTRHATYRYSLGRKAECD